MKIISLNIWDARVFEPLMNFFNNNQDVDIFCLQEVFNSNQEGVFRGDKRLNGFSEIAKRLPNHTGYFTVTEVLDELPPQGIEAPYGLAIFVKKDIEVLSHHHDLIFQPEYYVHEDAKTHKRFIQSICVLKNGAPISISNVHGLWNGQGKTDTQDRIKQSNKIKNHVGIFEHPVVLVGDFNLLPDTKSLAIIKENMRDLIAEYKITSTRSALYTKHKEPVLFADYAFTSPEIEIKHFEVLQDEVSDHLPLLLEI